MRPSIHKIWPDSLRARLVFGVATVHSLMMCAVVIDLAWEQREIFLGECQESASALTRAIATTSSGALVSHDVAGLQDLIAAQQNHPDCEFALITDANGLVLAHTDKTKRAQRVADLPATPTESVLSKTPGLVDVASPIFVGTKHVGWARVGVSLRNADDKFRHVARDGILFTVIASVIGVIVAWFMSRYITSRFDDVVRTLNRVRDGDRMARTNATGNDDVAMLGREFDLLLDDIRVRDERLAQERARFETLFNETPVAICVEDGSKVKERLVTLHQSGVTDFRAYFDQHPEEIAKIADDIRIIEVNPRTLELYKISSFEQLDRQASRYFCEETLISLKEILVALCEGKTRVETPMALVNGHGEKIYVELAVAVQPGYETTLGRVITSAFDITERRRIEASHAKLEQQLHQTQKIESIGRLAGGMAHDFNNMLTVILGHTELAMRQAQPGTSLHDELTEVRTAASRSVNLIRQLLAFARKQTYMPRVLRLNEVIDGMLRMLERLIGENIRLDWQPQKELWHVKIDPSQIDQILANLCVNARDAIADIGTITITTRNVLLSEADCGEISGCAPGEYVLLEVRDTGSGMSKETLVNIFEPFFTTKGPGKGTGLGLPTVYGIVKQNGGFVTVESSLGHGSTFKLYLPRCLAEETSAETPVAEAPSARGTAATLLVVEDEPAILALTTKMLELQGYTVHATTSAKEAIAITRQLEGKIDLVLSDVVMPEMNGRDLVTAIRKDYPALRCLFMSGHTAEIISRNGEIDPGVHFIPKPFRAAALFAKVREMLDLPANEAK